jgi:hypothetical protein
MKEERGKKEDGVGCILSFGEEEEGRDLLEVGLMGINEEGLRVPLLART